MSYCMRLQGVRRNRTYNIYMPPQQFEPSSGSINHRLGTLQLSKKPDCRICGAVDPTMIALSESNQRPEPHMYVCPNCFGAYDARYWRNGIDWFNHPDSRGFEAFYMRRKPQEVIYWVPSEALTKIRMKWIKEYYKTKQQIIERSRNV